jgi:hypothetical protein
MIATAFIMFLENFRKSTVGHNGKRLEQQEFFVQAIDTLCHATHSTQPSTLLWNLAAVS